MRKQTKMALNHLAQTMVDASDTYISLRGTAQFIEWALRLHKMTGSYVTTQTIRTHQQELEEMCQAEMLKRHPLKKDIIVPKQFDDDVDEDEDEEWYWSNGDMVDYQSIIRRALELIKIGLDEEIDKEVDSWFEDEDEDLEIEVAQTMNQQVNNLVVTLKTPVKNYSMFIEGEDGLMVIRGAYTGKYVSDIDKTQWIGCSIGWSKKMLKDNETLGATRPGALTEDDKNVFLDIISGREV